MSIKEQVLQFYHAMSLRMKILISLTGMIVLIFGGVLVFITIIIEGQTKELIRRDFKKTKATFQRIQNTGFERLLEANILISEQPQFKAILDVVKDTIDRETSRTVRFNLNEFKSLLKCDIVFATNKYGTLIARTDNEQLYGVDYSALQFVSNALKGRDPNAADVWVENGSVRMVVCAPILLGEEVFGTIALVLQIKNSDADQLKKDTQSDVSFLLNNKIIASTLEEEKQVDLMKATFGIKEIVTPLKDLDSAGGVYELILKNEPYLTSFVSFGEVSSGRKTYFAISASLGEALKPLRGLQYRITIIGLLAVIITFVIGYFISDGITAPIKKLVNAVHRISAGDFTMQIETKLQDEIGQLSVAFNEMTVALRERYQMEKFVSSSTMDMIRRSKNDGVTLGGERKVVTVFFSDIRGFTAFSEKIDPEEVIGMLNMYLSKQAKMIMKFNGVIDKFVGDELVAVFEGENMVDNAVLCAVEIQREMDILYKQLDQKVRIGIGINTGLVVMGNMGSEERMDYTVMGNNVNLGARLCSMAAPGQIILSESSQRMLKIKIKNRPLEAIRVKGIENPVAIFEIIRS